MPGRLIPDYLINGYIFDNKAPNTADARSIHTTVTKTVERRQADRVVLTLDDSAVSIDALRLQFDMYPIPGLQQLIVVRNGVEIDFPL